MNNNNSLSYYLGEIETARQKGENLIAKRRGESALQRLNVLAHSPREEYTLYNQLGYVYSNLAEYSRAIDVSYKAYLIGLRHKFKPADIAYTSLMMASNLIMTKNIDQSLSQLEKVQEYFDTYGDEISPMTKPRQMTTLVNLAYCYLYKRDMAQAGEIIEKKLAPYQALPPATYGLSNLDYHHLRGEYLMEKGENQGAQGEFESCIRISDEEKFPIGKLEARIHLAIISLLHKRVADAAKLLRTIYRDARKLKSNSLMCEAALLLSKCYSLKDEPDRSAAMEKQVKHLLNKLDTNWLYEKIGEFDHLYQQLQKLYSLRESPKYVRGTRSLRVPEVLVDAMDKHYEANPDKYAIVGNSLVMQEVYHVIDKIAPTDLPILVQGQTGTGKELICRLIHRKSARSEKPYLAINCGAMPENLLENELFGHINGAYTGAMEDKKGYIELASGLPAPSGARQAGGTLMLDDVSNMSVGMQQKLLRVLEEHQVWPLGSEKSVPVDTRFIFASNQDIEELVRKKLFRGDLY
ncbi:MAG: sigma 54-interacting transcriptional regulator, partial [Planctomycetota bacterium]